MTSAADGLTLSRNETESLCMKAARGVGYSWGLAEEAGFAAGWLATRNFDALTPFLALLTQKRAQPCLRGAPFPKAGHWRALDGGPLCPIQSGAALTDHAALADGPFGQDTALDPVEIPLLLLPFLAKAAQTCRKHVTVLWDEGALHVTPEGAFHGLDAKAWAGPTPLALRISCVPGAKVQSAATDPINLPAHCPKTVHALEILALKTTVPATTASRSGAGSGTKIDD